MADSLPALFPPLTVSRESLLIDGRDDHFREAVQNLLRFSTQIQVIRRALARRMEITPPQYNIILALAHLSLENGATIFELSRLLGVTTPFIVEETRKLVVIGLVEKRGNVTDRRRVHIHLTKFGIASVETIAPLQRRVNNVLFGCLSRSDFTALDQLIQSLLTCCPKALSVAREVRSASLRQRRKRRSAPSGNTASDAPRNGRSR